MHLPDELIERLIDGELAPEAAANARSHAEACAECALRVHAAEQWEAAMLERLRALDDEIPRLSAEAIVRRARPRSPAWLRWAAAVVLGLAGAGVAYAAPGSPLPAILRRATAWVTERTRGAPAVAREDVAPAEEAVQGVAVDPSTNLRIAFEAHQPDGRAIIALVESAEVVVRARGGAARFTFGVQRLSIANAGSDATFEILIPRDAPRVEILVGARRLLLVEHARVRTSAPPDAAGRYVLSLASSPTDTP